VDHHLGRKFHLITELRDRVLLTGFRAREAALDKFDLAVVI
jgi:hypothetical protein